MTRILVTGGAGFIGSHIVEHLARDPTIEIRVLDNLSTGFISNIQGFLSDRVQFMYGDLTNPFDCQKAVDGIDMICHQAAVGSVPRSVSDPRTSHENNVNGFFNLVLAAKNAGIKRFVYASSSSVYGDNNELPKMEDRTGQLLSPYAVTKSINELYGQIFTRTYGMECIGLRYFNVFGPRQNPNGLYAAAIPKFIKLYKDGSAPTIYGDGLASRDFTYVDNVVKANILALGTSNPEAFGTTFNIGAGGRISILEVANIIGSHLGAKTKPILGEPRKGDILHSNADITKARNILGYEPSICFSKGIERLIRGNLGQIKCHLE